MQMIWHARHFLPPSTSSFSYSFKTVIRIPNSGICFQIWLAPQQDETWGRNTWACWEPWPKSSSEPGRDVRGPVGPNCGPFCWRGPANPGISLSLSCSLQSYVNTPKQVALFAFQSPASTLEDSKVMLIRETEEITEQNMVQGGLATSLWLGRGSQDGIGKSSQGIRRRWAIRTRHCAAGSPHH